MQQQSLDFSFQCHNLFSSLESRSFHLISCRRLTWLHLTSSHLGSSHLIWSSLFSFHLSAHLISSNFISSHVVSSHLFTSSHLIPSPFKSSLLFSARPSASQLISLILNSSHVISACLISAHVISVSLTLSSWSNVISSPGTVVLFLQFFSLLRSSNLIFRHLFSSVLLCCIFKFGSKPALKPGPGAKTTKKNETKQIQRKWTAPKMWKETATTHWTASSTYENEVFMPDFPQTKNGKWYPMLERWGGTHLGSELNMVGWIISTCLA